jgi:cardiolipin synthase
VDESHAILGGTNVGNEYLYLEPPDLTCDMTEEAEQASVEPWEKWEDAGVHLYGEAVKTLTRQFDLHWEQLGGTPLPLQQPPLDSIQTPTSVSILYQQPGYGEIAAAYLTWIEQAKESLWVASPYICFPDVLKTLAKASQRGVRVVLLHPSQHNDIPVEVDVFEQHLPTLVKAGVEVYENVLRMAHYKLMIVDNQRCLIGSFNLNFRSFRHDIEVNAAIDSADFAAELKSHIFEPGIARARQVTGGKPPSLSLLTRLVIEPFL